MMARSSGVQRWRGDESWIDISIQPSSSHSSASSDLVSTGIPVQSPNVRRRRGAPGPRFSGTVGTQCTSSQEEYEESDSDEDRVMTSSNEHLIPEISFEPPPAYDGESDSDRDKSSSYIGRRGNSQSSFTPQPNAFSHPPSSLPFRTPAGCFVPTHHPYFARNIYGHQSYDSPADHDAALRASLTTLLSIGAAAGRSLPKREVATSGTNQASNEPIGLRFVSEAEFMTSKPQREPCISRPRSSSSKENSIIVSDSACMKTRKQKAISGGKAWSVKKSLSKLQETSLSPTLLTWAMSAGVLVLISVVGFGTGYVIGREVGRQELLTEISSSGLSNRAICVREVMRSSSGGLRRFKWGIGSGSRSVFM